MTDYWLLITDYTLIIWLLITDCWLLMIDYWLLITDYWLLIADCWLLFCQFEELDGVVDSGTAEEVDSDGYHWGAVGFAVQVAYHAG